MYDQREDTLTSITMQLIALIRARSQTHNGLCEVAGARNAGTTVTVSLPIP